MSSDKIVSDLQKVNPSAIIELFTLTLDNSLHGATTTYRFHAGTSLKDNGEIIWQGNAYTRFPVQAEGFQYGKGQLPRPTLTFSNALSTFSSILAAVNSVSVDITGSIIGSGLINNDLTGAKVTRKRTLEKFLPTSNYRTVPSYNAFDSTYPEFPQEVYFIDRKSQENREVVQFELAANFDLAGVKAPRRLVTRDQFPSAGIFKG